jgi:hypothetical protein
MKLESSENAQSHTHLVCPLSTVLSSWVPSFHKRAVLSEEVVANRLGTCVQGVWGGWVGGGVRGQTKTNRSVGEQGRVGECARQGWVVVCECGWRGG